MRRAKHYSVDTGDLYRVQARCRGFDTLAKSIHSIEKNECEVYVYPNTILVRSCGIIATPRGRTGSRGVRVRRDIAL